MLSLSSRNALGAMVLMAALGVGCTKKAPIPPPPSVPSAADSGNTNPSPGLLSRPTIVTFTVEPSTVERGQSATLRWSVTNATSVIIDHGLGSVDVSGQRAVVPADSTTYQITARNENGSAAATTTVNVTAPAERPEVTPKPPHEGFTQQIEHLQDAYFDYDKNDIRSDAQTALTSDAAALKQIFADFPSAAIIVEGHCDERGSAEYNLGLGDRRASAARDFLVQLGVPADKLKTVSYGKERPKCTEATEDCYQQNRRAHFSAGQ